jgi:hypothetical protein
MVPLCLFSTFLLPQPGYQSDHSALANTGDEPLPFPRHSPRKYLVIRLFRRLLVSPSGLNLTSYGTGILLSEAHEFNALSKPINSTQFHCHRNFRYHKPYLCSISSAKMHSFPTIHHKTLNATLIPKECDSHFQFRGIKYAHVPARFGHSTPVDDWEDRTLDCREFGCEFSFRPRSYSLPLAGTGASCVPFYITSQLCFHLSPISP